MINCAVCFRSFFVLQILYLVVGGFIKNLKMLISHSTAHFYLPIMQFAIYSQSIGTFIVL